MFHISAQRARYWLFRITMPCSARRRDCNPVLAFKRSNIVSLRLLLLLVVITATAQFLWFLLDWSSAVVAPSTSTLMVSRPLSSTRPHSRNYLQLDQLQTNLFHIVDPLLKFNDEDIIDPGSNRSLADFKRELRLQLPLNYAYQKETNTEEATRSQEYLPDPFSGPMNAALASAFSEDLSKLLKSISENYQCTNTRRNSDKNRDRLLSSFFRLSFFEKEASTKRTRTSCKNESTCPVYHGFKWRCLMNSKSRKDCASNSVEGNEVKSKLTIVQSTDKCFCDAPEKEGTWNAVEIYPLGIGTSLKNIARQVSSSIAVGYNVKFREELHRSPWLEADVELSSCNSGRYDDKGKQVKTWFDCVFSPLSIGRQDLQKAKLNGRIACQNLATRFIEVWGYAMYETAIARALLGRYVPEYYVRSIRPRVEALSKELGSTTQCIGMHIRHGDTCINPDRGCRKLREYMRAAKMLKYKYNVSKIYLATDDPHVESALHKPKKYIYTYRRHFPAIVMQNISRRAFDFSNYSMLKDVDTATYPENRVKHLGSRPVTEFLVDIHMLRSCDYFVGTISSGIGRVVLALISSRLGRIPPFISLQEGLNRDGIFAVPGHKNTRRVNPT